MKIKRWIKQHSCPSPYYVREFEEYLIKMAADGQILEQYKRQACKFKEEEKATMDYRVVITPDLIGREYIDQLEQAGYQSVARYKEIHIFGAMREQVKFEVHRDLEMESRALARRKKEYGRYFFMMLGFFIVLMSLCYDKQKHIFLLATLLLGQEMPYDIYFLIAMCFPVLWGIETVYIAKERRRLKCKEGDSTEWRSSKRLAYIQSAHTVVIIGIIISGIMTVVLPMFQLDAADVIETSLNADVLLPMPRLEQIQEENNLGVRTMYGKPVTSGLIAQRYWLSEESQTGEGETISCYSRYYKLKTNWLAERFLKEQVCQIGETYHEEEAITNGVLTTRKEEGVDYVFYLPTNKEDIYCLGVGKGKQLVVSIYHGERSYEEVLQKIKQSLLDYKEC
ncbi:MAG: DUF2812 domain-containing protein [bacterium]|nr:DUF2812 domain-containing protein [bacterium]